MPSKGNNNRNTKERKKPEKKFKETDIDSACREYPNLIFSKVDDLQDITDGNILRREVCHACYDNEGHQLKVYNAKVETLKENKVYTVAYRNKDETYDAGDYEIPMFQFGADLLNGDFVFA